MPACWHTEGNLRSAVVPAGVAKAFTVDTGLATLSAALAVGFLTPETYVLQRDFLTKDIVAEAPASKREAILTVSCAYSFELLNVIAPGAVVRVGGKDLAHTILDGFKLCVAPQELF